MARRLSTFARLDWHRQALFVEALGLVSFAWTALHVLPFRWVRPLCGTPRAATDVDGTLEGLPRVPFRQADPMVREVAWALRMVHTGLGWDRSCLARAVAGRIMLRRRGCAPTLYIGAARAAGDMKFHAWLLDRGVPVTGVRGAGTFTTLAIFDGD